VTATGPTATGPTATGATPAEAAAGAGRSRDAAFAAPSSSSPSADLAARKSDSHRVAFYASSGTSNAIASALP